jgi:hypothetical protein
MEASCAWNFHRWRNRSGRQVRREPGKPLLHRVCVACGRDFVDDLSSTERFAVVSLFQFDRLADETTERWLSERCPGRRLPGDNADRETRYGS